MPFVASPWETVDVSKNVPFLLRSGLIFVGNMVNPTNIEGLRWFITNVMPEISKRDPSIQLTIIGGGGWTLPDIDLAPPIRFIGKLLLGMVVVIIYLFIYCL